MVTLLVGITLPLITWPMAVGAVAFFVYWVTEFVISIPLLIARKLGWGKQGGRVPASIFAQRITREDGCPEQTATPQAVSAPA